MKLNKIYCEDCMETMSRMPDGFIDLTVTSPPYDNLRTYNDNIDETWGEDVWKPIIKELYRVTKQGGVVVWVVGDATINGSESGVSFRQALWAKEVGFNLHDTMIYERPAWFPSNNHYKYEQDFEYMFIWSIGKPKTFNPIMIKKSSNSLGRNYHSNKPKTVRQKDGSTKGIDAKAKKRLQDSQKNKKCLDKNIWRFGVSYMVSTTDEVSFKHPAIYPEKLVSKHIKTWSNESDIVYDPFMGSGTTAKMAHLLKRKWIGSEISQEYVDLAYKRLEPYLTQATLF